MKILKAILMNPLVLATLITVVAGMVLVAYTDHKHQPGGNSRTSVRAADGVPRNLSAPPAHGQVDAATRKGESTPPVIVWGLAIPGGSYINTML